MGSKQFSIECIQVANTVDCELVNRCFNCLLTVGDYFYQVHVFNSDIALCSVSCFSFLTFEDALSFARQKFGL